MVFWYSCVGSIWRRWIVFKAAVRLMLQWRIELVVNLNVDASQSWLKQRGLLYKKNWIEWVNFQQTALMFLTVCVFSIKFCIYYLFRYTELNVSDFRLYRCLIFDIFVVLHLSYCSLPLYLQEKCGIRHVLF